jgi:hypothetical protein
MNVSSAAALLGLEPSGFTVEDIDKAFRRAALRHHPDKGGSSVAFGRVTCAAETLRDSLKGPEDWGLDVLVESLGRALNHVRVSAIEMSAVMTVQVFCSGLAREQVSGRDFSLEVDGNCVLARCHLTRGVLAKASQLPTSAVNFFTLITTSDDVSETSFHENGVHVLSETHFCFRSFSPKQIALMF